MVHVDDHIQTGLLSISHDLCYTVDPCLFYLVFRGFAEMSHPCDRDAHGTETSRLDLCEGLGGSLRISPERFARNSIVMGIELVAEVPSYSKSLRHLPSQIAVIFRHDRAIRTRARFGFLCCSLCDVHIMFFLTGHD